MAQNSPEMLYLFQVRLVKLGKISSMRGLVTTKLKPPQVLICSSWLQSRIYIGEIPMETKI